MPTLPEPEPAPHLRRSAVTTDVFRALAHPARRAIVEQLSKGPDDAGTISDTLFLRFALRASSTSNHLRILREAGIVDDAIRGVSPVKELRHESLEELRCWVERYVVPVPPRRRDPWAAPDW